MRRGQRKALNKSRYCTMPKIPWFRDWFEGKFGNLCKEHDENYAIGYRQGGCKLCHDFKFCAGIAEKGYGFLSVFVMLVLILWLPLWWKWFVNGKKT